MWRLRTTLTQRFAISFEDSDPVANHKLHEYEETLFLNARRSGLVALPKTELDGDLYEQVEMERGRILLLPRPFVFRMRMLPSHPKVQSGARVGRAMCLYDNAGEHFLPGAQSANAPGTRHLAVSKALLFVFDPTQHPKVRQLCEGKTNDPQVRSDLVNFRQDQILTEATRRIRAELGLRQDQRDKRPLIVVLTKYDAWCSMVGGQKLQDEWILQEHASGVCRLNVRMLKSLSDKFRKMLMKVLPEMVATAEAFSEDVTYIPVSALGCSPEEMPGSEGSGSSGRAALGIRPDSISPAWSDVPLLYAIHRTIPGMIAATSTPKAKA